MRRVPAQKPAFLPVLTRLLSTFVLLALIALHAPLLAEDATVRDCVTIVAEGSAALGTDRARAEDEAILDAKRNAVEKAVGVFLKSKAVGRNYSVEEDTIRTQALGFLKTWERLPGTERVEIVGENGAILHLEIKAEIALLPLLERLQDIREAYDDLDRPRIRVQIGGDTAEHSAGIALTQALKAEGFEVSEGAAEIVFRGQIETHPTVKLGDKNSPQSIGESIAACRAVLRLSVISETSEQNLLTFQNEATGSSFQSDASAKESAIEEAGRVFLATNKNDIIRTLLLHWATERQEGHTVVLHVTGLTPVTQKQLERNLAEWRGFRRILDSKNSLTIKSSPNSKNVTTIRVLTLLSNREFRLRLSELKLNSFTVAVADKRGSTISLSFLDAPEKRSPVRSSRTRKTSLRS